jgi:regulatory protein
LCRDLNTFPVSLFPFPVLMRLTALRPSRVPGHLIVEVDGARVALLPIERVRELGLVRGRELDEAASERLDGAAQAEDAYRAAVRLLAARPRSVQEVVRRLRQKKMPAQAVAEAVGRLEGRGLLDDPEFARAFARGRAERGYGPARILADLAARGVERRVAEVAVAELAAGDETDRPAELEVVARKRARQMAGLPPAVRKRRLVGYLSRRGFALGDVLRVVERVLSSRPR